MVYERGDARRVLTKAEVQSTGAYKLMICHRHKQDTGGVSLSAGLQFAASGYGWNLKRLLVASAGHACKLASMHPKPVPAARRP